MKSKDTYSRIQKFIKNKRLNYVMPYRRVHLGQEVSVGVLEKILSDAAIDIGWKAKIKDSYRTDYRLGSLHQEEKYRWTDVNLQGSFLPLGQVTFDKDKPTNKEISLYYGFGHGFATRKEIERYLLAVSKRIEALNKPS